MAATPPLFPVAPLYRALHSAAARLFGTDFGYASDQEAILATLQMLLTREADGARLFAAWTSRLTQQLSGLNVALDLPHQAPELAVELAALQAALAACKPGDAVARDTAEHDLLRRWAVLAEWLAQDSRLSLVARLDLVRGIAAAESQRTQERAGAEIAAADAETSLTPEGLQAYLAHRCAEPDLRVVEFRSLPGGFSKETTLFEVEGKALSGSFVMRRDRFVPAMDNDCHRIEREYQVICAAYAQGFPTPEVLWLDTAHELLPGGNFVVMRRAAGGSGGGVFGAAGQVAPELTKLLAGSMAKLHSLPQLRALGRVSEGIAPELWGLSIQEATSRYIIAIRDMYVRDMRTPSPAALVIFGWLLSNVPEAPGCPVLLHGDIGFHNFIIDDGRLTAVVDWEFAHIGDPAEDVGYVSNTAGTSLDWNEFITAYRAAGGPEISQDRLAFFKIWGQLRNLAAAQLTSQAFEDGKLHELKMGHVGHFMAPMFLDAITSVLPGAG